MKCRARERERERGPRWAWLLAAALAGCAHGGQANDDANHGIIDTYFGIDAAFCGNLPCEAIYVATTGSDTADGTKISPLKTISAGVRKAGMSSTKPAVFVMAGGDAEKAAME